MKKIILIAAVAQNGVIGNNNTIPWSIKDDMKFFKETTMGHQVVMGRKTYESFGGRLLPGRFNTILTKDPTYDSILFKRHGDNIHGSTITGYAATPSIEECLNSVNLAPINIFIIGGTQIYKEFLPYATHFYRTKVLADVEGDTYFPEIDESEWSSEFIMKGEQNERNQYPFIIEQLTHKNYFINDIIK